MKIYLVGGTVRDKLLSEPQSSDIDFAVEAPSYDEMVTHLCNIYKIVPLVPRPLFGSLRAKLFRANFLTQTPPHTFGGFLPLAKSAWMIADFTICRKDGIYKDGRHPDSITPGTIVEDLERRDFTINAIAVDEFGDIIYAPNSKHDIQYRMLRACGNPLVRFDEDALRILRAIRFYITHRLAVHFTLRDAIHDIDLTKFKSLPKERIYEELKKMFEPDSYFALRSLAQFPTIAKSIFDSRITLKPQLKD